MKKLIATFCGIVFLMASLISCENEVTVYEQDAKLLKDGPYCLEFRLVSDGEAPWEGTLAMKDDKYYLDLKGDTLILGEKASYGINAEEKEYTDHTSVDMNYTFFDTMLDLDIKGKSGEGESYTVSCKNENGRRVELYYTADKLAKIDVYLYPESYAEMADVPMTIEVVSLTSEIPENVIFDIPEGWKSVSREEFVQ